MTSSQTPASPNGDQGITTSMRAWVLRLSKPVSPLADVVDSDRSSNCSCEDAQFLTAAPNTPCSVTFPELGSPSGTATVSPQRTPKSSLSNESDQTAVETPVDASGHSNVKDIEAANGSTNAAIRQSELPLALRTYVVIGMGFVRAIAVIGLMLALCLNTLHDGWAMPSLISYAEAKGFKHVVFTTLPILVCLLFSLPASGTDAEVRRLQPIINLSRPHTPKKPERTMLLDYTSRDVFSAFFVSLRRDKLVALGSFINILSMFLQSLASALIAVRTVWWVGPDMLVNSTSRVGLSQPADFMDMTSLQAASSFASADIIYNIPSLPFVSGGYTVAEFELPKVQQGTNGTASTDRLAVLSQAACVAPDSLTIVNEPDIPLVWHNTALFGQCEYTWMIASNASYLYGLAPASFTGCGQDVGLVPLQYRPVLFWFFTYEPTPASSIVMCTPRAFAQNVSVAIDLATNATAVTPLQSSPDDTSVVDLGPFSYNGVFFPENGLDETVLARLQGIQQQLPGAVFEAARTKDPLLQDTFSNQGFTKLAQDVYTTYLSLVAKSVYFVDEHEPLSVRVGSNCKRIFIVAAAAIPLAGLLFLMLVLDILMHIAHRRARRGLASLPPHLGTLGAATWLTAQTDVAFALAKDDVGPKALVDELAGHRYYIDRSTGRVRRKLDDKKGDGRKSARWSFGWCRTTYGYLKKMVVFAKKA